MDEHQTSKLLTMASYADGREVDQGTVLMWYDLINHLDFDMAVDAMRAALKDDTIRGRFTPKDLLRHAESLQRSREHDQRVLNARQEKREWNGDPKPENFDAMVWAYQEQERARKRGDNEALAAANIRVATELGRYREQLIAAGIDPDHARYPVG